MDQNFKAIKEISKAQIKVNRNFNSSGDMLRNMWAMNNYFMIITQNN